VLVNGIPGHPVENLKLENIEVHVAGGGTAAQAKVRLAERESAYPEYSMFGKVMPAYGLYLRHVRGVQLNGIRTVATAPEGRPERVLIDVEGVVSREDVPAREPSVDATGAKAFGEAPQRNRLSQVARDISPPS
jgi:hypothetical protein